MKIRFIDPITKKRFTAIIVKQNEENAYLVPIWVKSKPSDWLTVPKKVPSN